MTTAVRSRSRGDRRVLKDCIEYLLSDVFLERPRAKRLGRPLAGICKTYFVSPSKNRKKWDAIEVDRLRAKTKSQNNGEFWIQTHEGDGNYNIKRWLEMEGGKLFLSPPVAVWLDYLFIRRFASSKNESNRGRRSIRGLR